MSNPPPLARFFVLWGDTDGQFHVKNFTTFEEADAYETGLNESGLPTRLYNRSDWLLNLARDAVRRLDN